MSDDVTILKHKIDPDQPNAHRFEDKEEIFFQDEFEEVLISICEHIDRLDEVTKSDLENLDEPLPDEERNLLHRHSTIGIFGQRGVGKTSFLLTITDAFDENSDDGKKLLNSFKHDLDLDTSKEPENLRGDVQTLDPIDPSRIENEDKLLVTITSTILDLVRDNNDGELQNNRAIQDALEDLSQRFRILFPDVTESVLEETASDPLRFAGEVLFDANSGPKLARAFHRFLALAAEDLGVRCFLLPIDDVDTSFDKGWPLLDTLRKYLATDRLITVVSGDLEFFDLIVEQEAHKRTEGYRAAKKDYSDIDLLDGVDAERKHESIRDYSDQYLQKIFPTHDRQRIPDVHSVTLNPNNDLYIEIASKNEAESGEFVPLGPALLVVSRLLFGTAYIPGNDKSKEGEITFFLEEPHSELDPNRASILSSTIGPNAIDALLPQNTRRFISLIESIPNLVDDLFGDRRNSDVSTDLRNYIAENHSGLLQRSGMDVEDFPRLANGQGFYKLSKALFQSKIGSVDLARLQPDLFRDLPSYKQWRALLTLVASTLYADWTSNMTGLFRYTTKVWDALSIAEQRGEDLDDIGAGLNEPSWKSRCRVFKAEALSVYEESSDLPETIGTAMRVPREKRYNYKKSNTFTKISPQSNVSPDYMRWWKVVCDKNEKDIISTKNRAVMPESKFIDYSDAHATALYGLFRSAFRSGRGSYRYIDFRRGLARIDDLVREHAENEHSGGHQSDGASNNSSNHEDFSLGRLTHEALDFVLPISGDANQTPGSSETGEERRKGSAFFGFKEVVGDWLLLAKDLSERRSEDLSGNTNTGNLRVLVGGTVLPSP